MIEFLFVVAMVWYGEKKTEFKEEKMSSNTPN
jgi:hypothetical protein